MKTTTTNSQSISNGSTTAFTRYLFFIPALFMLLGLVACGGGGGGSSSDSGNGNLMVATMIVNSVPAGTCTNGGITVNGGIDSNGNKVLDPSEVTSTQYVCNGSNGTSGTNGANGSNGLTTLVLISNEAAGANCSTGGKKVTAGLDANGNSVLDVFEVTTTAYICNGANGSNGTNGTNGADGTNGTNGSNGLNSLVSVVPVSAGAFCTYGGNKVSNGMDSNGNGVLDPAEVTASNYVCNGAPGATGPAGPGITWVNVTGTSVQAAANTGYMANNDAAQVTITLPAAPALGDEVRVSGLGTAGWKVAQNAGQYIIATDLVGGIGAAWTPRDAVRGWTSVASSADGMKLVAADGGGGAGGFLYTSTDAGVTWTPRGPVNKLLNLIAEYWISVASSSDGTMLVAAVSGGQLYTSNDSGATWTARESARNWMGVASSADGTKLAAAVLQGSIYTSTDSGVTWTPRLSNYWRGIASSSDGTKLVAVASTIGGGQIYTSTDSGATWTPRDSPRYWNSVASSSDGNRLVAANSGGQIYTSTDSGITWSAHGAYGNWLSVASSADGTKLIAGESAGLIYTSVDSGITWIPHQTGYWAAVASSADGTKLIAADMGPTPTTGGQLYTSSVSTSLGIAGSISGGQYDSIDLLCNGINTFLVLGHAGNLLVK